MPDQNNAALPEQPVCARCAARFPTCCRLGGQGDGGDECEGGYEGECFPLSAPEQERLERSALSWAEPPEAALFAEVPNSPDFLQAMRELFPGRAADIAARYPAGGRHLRLNLRPDGACVCLGAQGCRAPREARPWFCRLFPFWFQRGRLACFTPPDCLAVLESRSPRELLRSFGSSEAEARHLFAALCRDWGL